MDKCVGGVSLIALAGTGRALILVDIFPVMNRSATTLLVTPHDGYNGRPD